MAKNKMLKEFTFKKIKILAQLTLNELLRKYKNFNYTFKC